MTNAHKILLVFIAVQWLQATGYPIFQGLSFQRGFEINFKPWLKEPIVFIKEKWSPFGSFGKKISIQKRSLDDMIPPVPRPAAPVFEDTEEEPIGTAPLNIMPQAPVYTNIPKVPPPQILSHKPPQIFLPKPMPIIVKDYPPLSPIVPSISTNMVILPPTKIPNSESKGNTLYTDISRVQSIEKYVHSYEMAPSEPPKPINVPLAPLPSSPLPPATPIAVTPIPSPPIIENPSTVIVPKPPPPIVNTLPVPVTLKPPPPPPTIEVAPAPIAPEVLVPPVATEVSVPITPKTPAPITPEVVPVLPIEPAPIKEENKEKPTPSPPDLHEVSKTDIVLKDSSLVKGSKMALQFGSVFLTLMAQFFDRARATIDLMTNPPPKFLD